MIKTSFPMVHYLIKLPRAPFDRCEPGRQVGQDSVRVLRRILRFAISGA